MQAQHINSLPALSMGLRLQVMTGYNQVQRNRGNYSALYLTPGSRLAEEYIELPPNTSYYSNPGESTSTLVVATSIPLVFTATSVAGNLLNLDINRMLVLDTPLANFVITNPGTVPARISVNAVNYTNMLPAAALYYGAADIPSVFNQAFIESLTKSMAPKNQTVAIDAGDEEKYLFYCYPVLLGQSNFEANGFVGGVSVVALVTVQSPAGILQYYVYQSDNPGLGVTTLTITGA